MAAALRTLGGRAPRARREADARSGARPSARSRSCRAEAWRRLGRPRRRAAGDDRRCEIRRLPRATDDRRARAAQPSSTICAKLGSGVVLLVVGADGPCRACAAATVPGNLTGRFKAGDLVARGGRRRRRRGRRAPGLRPGRRRTIPRARRGLRASRGADQQRLRRQGEPATALIPSGRGAAGPSRCASATSASAARIPSACSR